MKRIIASAIIALVVLTACENVEKPSKPSERPSGVSGTSRKAYVKEKTTALSDDGTTQYWLVIKKVPSGIEFVIQVPQSKFDDCNQGQTWNLVLKACE